MTTHTVQVAYPDSVLTSLSEEQVRSLAQEALVVRLYDQGLISSGQGASMLTLSRSDFLDLLGTYGVSYFDDQIDFAEELRNAQP
jgi:predicted HTH domain antitoxin